jgi:hypothetical protein
MNAKTITAIVIAVVLATGVLPLILYGSAIDGTFTPTIQNFGGNQVLIWAHIITNLLIGLAYMAIPITLITLAKRAGKKIPFTWVFFAFGIFIVGCGMTHFVDVLTTWTPSYWLTIFINYTTAFVSIATAILIVPVVPKVLALVDSAEMSEQRKLDLTATNEKLMALNHELEESHHTLAAKVAELEKLNSIMVGREVQMNDMKKELAETNARYEELLKKKEESQQTKKKKK